MRRGPKPTTRSYPEVRGLARGLTVLKALNRKPGGIGSTTELAKECELDRTTTKRLLETLRAQGLVEQGERDGQYYLSFEVLRLSEGFRDETWVGHVASHMMHDAVKELVWPCDLGTPEAGFMVVRESTHRWSLLSQHRAMVGRRMPMLATAIGRAFLAACSATEREGFLEMLRHRDDAIGAQARDSEFVERILQETLERGYAFNAGEWSPEASFAAIGVPVMWDDRAIGALNLVFPKGAVSQSALDSRFVPALKNLAQAISKASRPWVDH